MYYFHKLDLSTCMEYPEWVPKVVSGCRELEVLWDMCYTRRNLKPLENYQQAITRQ